MKKALYPILSYRLKNLRKMHNERQADTADAIGIKRAAYSSYEVGRVLPPYAVTERLATHFNVSVEYLLGKTNRFNSDESMNEFDIIDIADTVSYIITQLKNPNEVLKVNDQILTNEEKEILLPAFQTIQNLIEVMP